MGIQHLFVSVALGDRWPSWFLFFVRFPFFLQSDQNVCPGLPQDLVHVVQPQLKRRAKNRVMPAVTTREVSHLRACYLRDRILRGRWRFVPAEVRQSSAPGHSVHPDAFINLAFVRIEELPVSVLVAIPPGAVKPVSIYWKKSVAFSNGTPS